MLSDTTMRIAISPCPNDTFAFDAIYNNRIPKGKLEFLFEMKDIEELNCLVFKREVDICKISFNAYAQIADDYQILDSGSALGRNCGPLLISKKPQNLEKISSLSAAIPGEHTTANFLLGYALPALEKKTVVLFSEIENCVLEEKYDLGLIIHENRFTYFEKGLHKIIDLGEYWEEKTGYPIPLGCIVIKRSLPESTKQYINNLIRQSVLHAYAHPNDSKAFIRQNAQEMDEDVCQQHINLYVNDYSIDLGVQGRIAINHFFDEKERIEKIKISRNKIFLSF